MKVQMKLGLAGIVAGVEYRTVPTLRYVHRFGDLRRHGKQVPDDAFVRFVDIVQPAKVNSRYDEKVNGGLRFDVVKGHRPVIGMNDAGGQAAGDDATEQAIFHAEKHVWTSEGLPTAGACPYGGSHYRR